MTFIVGDKVVHPAHGVGVVKEVTVQRVLGHEAKYYVIETPLNELDRVMVPVANADSLGLRPVACADTIDEMLKILRDRRGNYFEILEDESFHRRHKEYLDKVQSGNILEVAKVFKTLFERSRERDLGLKEKFLMERAEKMIMGELSFARNISFEKAQEVIESGTA
jgi:CarD family transcriptional regulator